MLLKIITLHGTTKIISDIEEPEVHTNHSAVTWADLYAAKNTPPHRRDYGSIDSIVQTETFDWKPKTGAVAGADNPIYGDTANPPEAVVHYVDFLCNGQHRRVGILNFAYLCNDEGRTIQKIG